MKSNMTRRLLGLVVLLCSFVAVTPAALAANVLDVAHEYAPRVPGPDIARVQSVFDGTAGTWQTTFTFAAPVTSGSVELQLITAGAGCGLATARPAAAVNVRVPPASAYAKVETPVLTASVYAAVALSDDQRTLTVDHDDPYLVGQTGECIDVRSTTNGTSTADFVGTRWFDDGDGDGVGGAADRCPDEPHRTADGCEHVTTTGPGAGTGQPREPEAPEPKPVANARGAIPSWRYEGTTHFRRKQLVMLTTNTDGTTVAFSAAFYARARTCSGGSSWRGSIFFGLLPAAEKRFTIRPDGRFAGSARVKTIFGSDDLRMNYFTYTVRGRFTADGRVTGTIIRITDRMATRRGGATLLTCTARNVPFEAKQTKYVEPKAK
jgi:hypothetical protein